MKELNLIPYELKEKEEKTNKKRQTTSIIILAGLIVFSAIYFPMAYSSVVKGKETRLKNEVTSKKYVIDEYNQVQSSIAEIKAHMEIADGVDKSKVYISNVLDKLSLQTPGAVTFTNFAYQSGSITITADSSDYNSIFEFAANLETSENFGTAKIGTVTFNKDKSNYTFNLTIPQKEAAKK